MRGIYEFHVSICSEFGKNFAIIKIQNQKERQVLK